MKTLKTLLILTYIIIILLLLSLMKCEGNTPHISPYNPVMPITGGDPITDKPIVKEKFKADVVMCIDGTTSMEKIISTIKSNAFNFYSDLKNKCMLQGKEITSMRIKVIGFRDFEDPKPFEQSVFFDMPAQETDFRSFVSELKAEGGGDYPERGYDAIGLAILSDWKADPDVHQIIILWTDDASHPLSISSPGPKSINELTALWNERMSPKGKRLILFAPKHPSWTKLENEWDKTIRHDVKEGRGLSDTDYDEILETLSESM